MTLTPEQISQLRRSAGRTDSDFSTEPNPGVADMARRRKMLERQQLQKQTQEQPKGFFEELKGIGEKRGAQFQEAADRFSGGQNIFSTGLQATGAVLGGAADVIGAGIGSAYNALGSPLKEEGEKVLKSALNTPMLNDITLGQSVQILSEDLKRLKQEKPELGANIDALLGIGSFAASTMGLEQGLGTVAKVEQKTRQAVGSTLSKFDELVNNVIPKVESTVSDIKKVGTGIKETASELKNKASGAVERIEINSAQKQALRQAYEELDDVSKGAVQKGLLPRDVNLINSATPEEKGLFKKLKETASKFANDRTSTPPSELLGNEWLKRLEALDKQVGSRGQKLGKFVENIPADEIPNVMDNVVAELNKVRGLEELTVNSEGVLNFANTTLSSSVSKAERKIIQQIFDDIKGRGGKSLHQLRQELFEELGGKKTAGLKLTGTEENAVNAMRKGIANSLDGVSDGYKALNQEYAKLAELRKEIKKVFGEVAEGNEDIFKMKSSVLLRRLTNNAKSGQDISELIRETEKALSGYGIKFGTDITKVQEFMNLLNRYYDIAGDTSMLGILRTADVPLSKKGVVDKIINTVFENASASDATAQKAIEELLSTL